MSEDADRIYRALSWAGTGACSIGFVVVERRAPTSAERAAHGDALEWIATKSQLLELSIVGVGADGGAVLQTV